MLVPRILLLGGRQAGNDIVRLVLKSYQTIPVGIAVIIIVGGGPRRLNGQSGLLEGGNVDIGGGSAQQDFNLAAQRMAETLAFDLEMPTAPQGERRLGLKLFGERP